MSAEIQRHSPLTDLKEGRNELDWRRLFFFSFEILDVCGAACVFQRGVLKIPKHSIVSMFYYVFLKGPYVKTRLCLHSVLLTKMQCVYL